MRHLFVLTALALLTACAQQPTLPPAPAIVRVPQTTYVPITASLTAPCAIAEPPPHPTVGDALRVARERKAALEACNADKAQIRAVQGTPQEHHP